MKDDPSSSRVPPSRTGLTVGPVLRGAIPWIALAGIVAAGAVVLQLAGFDAARAVGALWSSAFGSWYALTSATLVRATPLVLTGLAVAIAFRAGVWNIGAEGQLLAGAAAAAAVGLFWGPALGHAAPVLELLAGAIAGAAWAWVPAVLRFRFHVLEVISTIMMNFVAVYGVGYLVRGPLQEPLHIYPQSPALSDVAQLPHVLPASRLHAGFPLAVVACAAAWWITRYTAAGFRARAVGANPDAAAVAGKIDVARTTTRVFIASGALAGLAGAIELTGVTLALYENLSPGYGYTAIAVALLARLDALGVIVAGILFGALEAGAAGMQRDAGVPAVVASVVEALVILLLLATAALQARAGGAIADTSPAPIATDADA